MVQKVVQMTEVETLKSLLRELEWSFDDYWCPMCDNMSEDGHLGDCRLALALKPSAKPDCCSDEKKLSPANRSHLSESSRIFGLGERKSD